MKISEDSSVYKIMKNIYYITTFLSFFMLNNNISSHVPGRIRYIVSLIFIFITFLIFLATGKKYIKKDSIFFAISNLYPFFIILFFSTVAQIINNDTQTLFSTRNIFTLCYFLIPILQMICVVYLFKDESINITFYAIAISYVCNIYLYFKMFKLNGLIHFFDYFDSFKSPLEAHELVFTLGLYFIYFLLYEKKTEKMHKFKLITCTFIIFLGIKRIQIIAIMITICMYKVIKKIGIRKGVLIIGCFSVFFSYIYILIVRSEFLDFISQQYNINFMSRLQAYDYFRDKYSMSLFYFGKGISYISKVLSSVGDLLYGIGDLHNDILKYYIELGFIRSYVFFINYLVLQPKRLMKKFDKNTTRLYFLLTFFTFIIMCSDNVSRYLQYLLSYSMIPFAYYIKLKSEKNLICK